MLQSEVNFVVKWSSVELVGKTSLVSVEGAAHTRVRSLVLKAISEPDALRKITLMVQPQSWLRSNHGPREAESLS